MLRLPCGYKARAAPRDEKCEKCRLAFAEFIRDYVQNPARSSAGVLDFQRKSITYGTELHAAKNDFINDPQVVEIYNQG